MRRVVAARRRCGAAVALVALLVGACSFNTSVKIKAAPKQATVGGTLVVGITTPASIEPTNAYEPEGALVVRTMCDSLVQLDPATGKLRGGLAKTFANQPSGNGLTMTLKKGLRFSNGDKVTARDIQYSLTRIASEDYGSALAPYLDNVRGYPAVHGGDRTVSEKSAARKNLSGVHPIAGNAFEISLVQPDAEFIRLLAQPFAAPIPRKVADDDPLAFARQPVCVGPYRMAKPWLPGNKTIELERTPDYYAKNEAYTSGGTGYAEKIVFRIFADRAAELAAFGAGEIDIAHVAPTDLAVARAAGGDLVSAPTGGVEFVAVPNSQGPLSSAAVRVALSQAVNRQAIVDGVYGGSRLPADGFLPPTLGQDRLRGGCGANTPLAGDVPAAQATLARANVELPPQALKLYFNEEPSARNRELMAAVASQWETTLGLRVELVGISWDEMLAKATSGEGMDGPFRHSWSSPSPSPISYLSSLFSTSQIGAGNLERYSDRDFDRVMTRKVFGQTNDDERRLQTQQLEERLCEQMPLIPITFGARWYLVRTAKVGAAVASYADASSGDLALREMYVKG